MIASASSNAAATIGSRRRSSPSMFGYCEPWPVYRKATLPGAPRPTKMPRAAALPPAGAPPRSACSAFGLRPVRPRRRSRSRSARPRGQLRVRGGRRRGAPGRRLGQPAAAAARLTSSRLRRRARPRRAAAPSAREPAAADALRADAATVGAGELTGSRRRSRCRPGTYSSSTTWKLVPPKPNALTPAPRTPPRATSQSRSSVLTANGMCPSRRLGWAARS